MKFVPAQGALLHHTTVRGLGVCLRETQQIDEHSGGPCSLHIFEKREDGSGRAARLSWAVVAERSSIFLPPYPGINPVWVFCKGRFHLTKHTFQHPPWKSPLSFKTFARFPTRSPNCARQHQSCDPALAPKHWGPCVPTTDCCSLTPGVRPGMMLQHQLRDHAIKGQRLVS